MKPPSHIETSDRTRIAIDYRPVAGAPVLVLSNSLGTDMSMWEPQIESWSSQFSILRYDTRGHGGSDCPPGSYSIDRLALDAIEILDALAIERAHFCGLSLGGMTGQRLGRLAPDRFKSITLAATSAHMGPPSGWQDRIETINAGGMQAIADKTQNVWFTPKYQSESGDEVARLRAIFLSTDVTGYAGCCGAIRDMDLRASARLNTGPVLVIAGADDHATPVSHSEFLVSQMPDARLAMLAGAHLVNFQQPQKFAQLVSEFIHEHD